MGSNLTPHISSLLSKRTNHISSTSSGHTILVCMKQHILYCSLVIISLQYEKVFRPGSSLKPYGPKTAIFHQETPQLPQGKRSSNRSSGLWLPNFSHRTANVYDGPYKQGPLRSSTVL
uniref:Ovule protein n=1 Tax=Steinernema glaseri TaxID=37863 RepID=A0A1I7YJ91_9BILA